MDDKNIALDLLKENSATFLNIIDSSEVAKKVFFEQYQKMAGRSAVPLNYFIDRKGKVFEAGYGYDEELHAKILKKLGIK